ncbi:TPA: hypothetical protein U1C40_000055 [Streptococcus suis]|nr:hypothetical protein [Streptococcus suis]HEM3647479.1 hypothetical protein [Streptococcus suis]
MDIELVSKPSRKLLNKLVKHKDNSHTVLHKENPKITNVDNIWLEELIVNKLVWQDNALNVIITKTGLTYKERRKAYFSDIMLTSFWLPILVSIVVSLLTSAVTIQLIQTLIEKINYQ